VRWPALPVSNQYDKSERVGPFNNHVARKLKLGPAQGTGDRWGERVEFYSMKRDAYPKKSSTWFQKIKIEFPIRCSEKVCA
jgi:hypothetical protein